MIYFESEESPDGQKYQMKSLSEFDELISSDANEDADAEITSDINPDLGGSEFSAPFDLLSSDENFVKKKVKKISKTDVEPPREKVLEVKENEEKGVLIKSCSLAESFDIFKSSNKDEWEGVIDDKINIKLNDLCEKESKENKADQDNIKIINEDMSFMIFKTGNNKKIVIDQEKLQKVANEIVSYLNGKDNSLIGNDLKGNDLKDNSLIGNDLKDNSLIGNDLKDNDLKDNSLKDNDLKDNSLKDNDLKDNKFHNENKRVKEEIDISDETMDVNINIFTKVNKNILKNNNFLDSLLDFLYDQIKYKFRNRDSEWILTQFKWVWLDTYINSEFGDVFAIQQRIYELMQLKLSDEKSILRRIVEFDDIPGRFMELGIIRMQGRTWEVYDGYYSLNVEVDELIERTKYSVGDKIYVFGAELLINSAVSIYELGEKPVLMLRYNGVRKARRESRLGYKKKVGFLTKIGEIRKEGGVVSGIEVKIKRILETKYLVYVDNYRNSVEDIEEEVEKIVELCKKAGRKVKSEDLNIRRYCKMVVEDSSGECVLTWWNYGEPVRENERYRFIYLNTVTSSQLSHLSTSRKTYIEKIS